MLKGIGQQLKVVLRCRNLWICGGLIFLVQLSPGYTTPLFYYQTNVLKLTPQFIGNLMVAAGVMGLVGSLVYPFLCRKSPPAPAAVHVDFLPGYLVDKKEGGTA